MKIKKLSKKLTLNKNTIANLGNVSMQDIKAGNLDQSEIQATIGRCCESADPETCDTFSCSVIIHLCYTGFCTDPCN